MHICIIDVPKAALRNTCHTQGVAVPVSSIISHTKISLKIQTPQKKQEYVPGLYILPGALHTARGEYTPLLFASGATPTTPPFFCPQSQTMAAHPLFLQHISFYNVRIHINTPGTTIINALCFDAVYLFMRWQGSRPQLVPC